MKPWTRHVTLLGLLAFVLATTLPAQAGTEAAPEIQDPANDQELLGEVGACAQTTCAAATRIDAVSVWIDGETDTSFNVNIKTTGDPGGATSATSRYEFHATFDGAEVVSVVTATGGQTISPPAPTSNVAAVSVSGKVLTMTILKSVYGAPAGGQALTNLFYFGTSNMPAPVPDTPGDLATDRAPNTGGVDYTFSAGGGNTTDPDDSDGDGLNDTCETEFFGDLNGTDNATEDPDGDGLTNGQECASSPRTDPTKADTDGDGTSDKDDPFPTDATKGGTSGSQSSSSTSKSSSTSGTRSTTSGTRTGSSGTGNDDGEVKNLGDAVERLQSDMGYLGTSAGGMVAVLLLAILALAVRWSL